jgi:hypothetical protein
MKLSPFVFEESGTVKNSAGVDCFDEASPCVLEQYSQCVIELSGTQTKYVPWLICMDTNGETTADVKTCATAQGLDYTQVSNCQKVNGTAILKQLVKADAAIDSTPTVKINGKAVGGSQGPTYKNVKAALCKADSSLAACSSTDDDAVVV